MAIAGLVCGCCSIFTMALLFSILLPSLSRARELSKRLVCAANLKGIATTVLIYQNDHPGQGVPTLDHLVALGEVTPSQLICPSSGLNTTNYKFIPDANRRGRAVRPWIYEPISNHGDEGGNVAFTDGSTKFLKRAEYEQTVGEPFAGSP